MRRKIIVIGLSSLTHEEGKSYKIAYRNDRFYMLFFENWLIPEKMIAFG